MLLQLLIAAFSTCREVSNEYKGVAWFNIGLTEQYSLVNSANAKEAYIKAGGLNPGLKASAQENLSKIQ